MRIRTGDFNNNVFISDLVQTLYDGGDGSDSVDYRQATAPVVVDLSAGTGPFGDTYISIESIRGSSFGDHLTGNSGVNTLVGREGADTLIGGDGDDVLHGGDGSPDARTERDLLYGGAGNDILTAGYGDFVDGGAGFDTLLLSWEGAPAPPSHYTIDFTALLAGGYSDFQNIERIEGFWGSEFDDRIYLAPSATYWLVHSGAGDDQVFAHADSGASVFGGSGNDQLTGSSAGDSFSGEAGNDIITGGRGQDFLSGGDGNDTISSDRPIGFDGNIDFDDIRAGAGNDVIFAGYGDMVDGGEGFDTLNLSYVGAPQGITGDTKVLFAGEPLFRGGGTVQNIERFDAIALTNFNDVMVIGDQADPATAYGYGGDDHLIGQENRVVMHGGDGNDLLVGSTANDELYGDRGNDILIGGPGTDLLFGGDGNDRFLFNQTGATDTIGDFQTGVDKIDLTDIDANSSVVGNQSFTFIGSAAFSGKAGELRVYNAGSIGNVVAIDVNGDSTADLMINLGSGTAVVGDFLL